MLSEVETDKAVVEIEAQSDGILGGVTARTGDVIPSVRRSPGCSNPESRFRSRARTQTTMGAAVLLPPSRLPGLGGPAVPEPASAAGAQDAWGTASPASKASTTRSAGRPRRRFSRTTF